MSSLSLVNFEVSLIKLIYSDVTIKLKNYALSTAWTISIDNTDMKLGWCGLLIRENVKAHLCLAYKCKRVQFMLRKFIFTIFIAFSK